MMTLIHCLLCCVLQVGNLNIGALSTFGTGQDRTKDDISIIRDRIIQPFVERDVDLKKIEQLLKTMKSDGSWDNIDYHDSTRAGWKLRQHLVNLSDLAFAYKSQKSPIHENPELEKSVFGSLDYWLRHDFQNPNWWHNTIGVPRLLGSVLLLLDGELTHDQRKKGIEILQRGKLGMTGQNLIWVAEITIIRGVLENNPCLLDSAFKRIADEIKITTEEGIQPDFSFHQHGACLYNHGYGSEFAADCSWLARIAAGTQFAFAQEKINILSSYVLDGSQWMAYGVAEDYGADGREIARPGQNARYLFGVANDLLQLPTGREKELQSLAARTTNREAAPLQGNRHFWKSDIMTHLRKTFYTSARMYSTRVYNTDGPSNSEGLKSHYIAEGCNFLFVSGDEYQDIFPVWDWQKIPGTTVEQTDIFTESPRRKGTTDFVGGVSDGRYGLAVFHLERSELQAHKAWFFFDREYVCLGAGITCQSENNVFTTTNQCYLRGNVTVWNASGEKQFPRGEHRLTSPITVYHNNVAYLFGSNDSVLLRNVSQEGSWYEISRSRPKDKIFHDIFTVLIDHGRTPHNATYAYTVYPGVDKQQAKAYTKKPGVEVLCNTVDIQAVKHRNLNLTQIVFFQSGSLQIDEKTTVSVDKPCLLLIHRLEHGMRVSVSDPTQKLDVIHLKLSGRLQGDACLYDPENHSSTVSFTLPKGGHAGQSIVRTFINDN